VQGSRIGWTPACKERTNERESATLIAESQQLHPFSSSCCCLACFVEGAAYAGRVSETGGVGEDGGNWQFTVVGWVYWGRYDSLPLSVMYGTVFCYCHISSRLWDRRLVHFLCLYYDFSIDPFVYSSGQILLPWYLVNGLSNLDQTYSEYAHSWSLYLSLKRESKTLVQDQKFGLRPN